MRRFSRLPLVLLATTALSAYFIAHTISGRHGLEALNRTRQHLTEQERAKERLEADRDRLKADIRALSSEPPSSDIVREIAADVLRLVPPGSTVIAVAAPAQGR